MIRPTIAIAAAGLLLTACSTSPARTVFAAKTGLTTAEAGILTYDQLPRCSAVVTTLCSTPAVVLSLQAGKNTARQTINQAEAAVRAPTTQSSAVKWATAALAAVKALLASLPQGASK